MTGSSPHASPPSEPLHVYVLCAQWCGVCRDYQAFYQAQTQLGNTTSWHWVDVEEHADALDALDIENFPTLLVTQGRDILFFGTVLPQPEVALRLIQSIAQGNRYAPPELDDPEALLDALRQIDPVDG